MDLTVLTGVIGQIGFPAACVIGMGWFIYQIFQKTTTQSEETMKQLQENCQRREDKLYEEIKENREVNAQAIATIALYADKLTTIQNDVSEIKTDMAVLMNNQN